MLLPVLDVVAMKLERMARPSLSPCYTATPVAPRAVCARQGLYPGPAPGFYRTLQHMRAEPVHWLRPSLWIAGSARLPSRPLRLYLSESLVCSLGETMSTVLGRTAPGASPLVEGPRSLMLAHTQAGGGVGKQILALLVAAVMTVVGLFALELAGVPLTDPRGRFTPVVYGPTRVIAAPNVPTALDTAAFAVQLQAGAPRAAMELTSTPLGAAGVVTLPGGSLDERELQPLYQGFVRDVAGGRARAHQVCPAHMRLLGVSETPSETQTMSAHEGYAEGSHLNLDPQKGEVDIALFDHTSGGGSGSRSPMNDLLRLPALATYTSPPKRAFGAVGSLGVGPGDHFTAPFFARDMHWSLNIGADVKPTVTVTVGDQKAPGSDFPAEPNTDLVIARALGQQVAAAYSAGMLTDKKGSARLFTFIGFRGNAGWHYDRIGSGARGFEGVLSLTAGLAAGDGTGGLGAHQVPVYPQEATSARVVRTTLEGTLAEQELVGPGPTVPQRGSPEVDIQVQPAPGATLILRQRPADAGRQVEHAVQVDRRHVDPHRQIVGFAIRLNGQTPEGGRAVVVPLSVQGGGHGGGRRRRKRRTRRARLGLRTRRARRKMRARRGKHTRLARPRKTGRRR